MFDIGFSELLVVAVIGLLVVGPERLPGVAYKLGQWLARIQKYIQSARNHIDREMRSEELRQMMAEQGDEMSGLKKSVEELKQEIAMHEIVDDVKAHNRQSHKNVPSTKDDPS